MHFSVAFLPVLLFLGLVNAAPTPGENGHDNDWWDGQKCLTDQEASDISTAFEGFYGVFDLAQAESLIADDFQSISDSNGNFCPNFVVRYSSLNLEPHIHPLYAIFTPLRRYVSSSPIHLADHSCQVGSVAVPSKAEFILEQSTNSPPYFSFTTLNVWHTCNVITFRWLWHVSPVPARGIDGLVMVWRDGRWQIQTDYSEFNDVVALRDFGII